MPIRVITFSDALSISTGKHYLLMGNGFSIALKPDIFSYQSLYKRADFSKIPYATALFKALGTNDFEAVIKVLIGASKLLLAYPDAPAILIEKLKKDADEIKNVLVTAIGKNHPDRPFDVHPTQYAACRTFLSNFSHLYTLNYDILLYWALMQDEVDDRDLLPDDGFRHPEDEEEAPYVSWLEAHSPTVHFLHGALHLFDAGSQIIKYTWSRTDIPLLDQIRDALSDDRYPLFVAEGESQTKLEKILHNAYLHKAYRSFESICDQKTASLFIFGHSLAANDDHILRRIERGRIGKLFVSLHGDPASDDNVKIISKAQALVSGRNRHSKSSLELGFFDAQSAAVWG